MEPPLKLPRESELTKLDKADWILENILVSSAHEEFLSNMLAEKAKTQWNAANESAARKRLLVIARQMCQKE